jgi:outer membrane protein
MKKIVIAALVAAAFAPALAQADAGDFVVRLRAVDVRPDVSSKLGADSGAVGLGAAVSPGAQLDVNSNVIPELDLSYYITKNIAAELILAVGTRHDVSIKDNTGALGNQPLGSVNLLPPTLTAQWHFMPDQTFDPYVGAGLTYSRAMDNKLATTAAIPGLPIRIDRNSWGPAIQAGFDINLKDGWLINADVKKVWLNTDVKINAGAGYVKIDSLDLDPWVIGVGFGKKF